MRKKGLWLSILIVLPMITTAFTVARAHTFTASVPQGDSDPTSVYVAPSNNTDLTLTPIAKRTLKPMGDGTFAQLKKYPPGTNAWDDWNDWPQHDGDSTYLYADAKNLKQSSALENLGTVTWNISKVKVVIFARSNVTTDDTVAPILVIGGIKYEGKPYTVTSETYTMCTSEWGKNPKTKAYWNWTDIDALEAGVVSLVGKDVVWDTRMEIRVTQLYVEVTGPRYTANIWVGGVTSLWGYQFEMSFNPDIVQGVWLDEGSGWPVEVGPFLGSAGGTVYRSPGAGWNNTLGKLWLTGASLWETTRPYCPNGTGIVASVIFEVVRKGETEVRLGDRTALKDVTGAWIPISLGHGYFRNVNSGDIPKPSFEIKAGSVPLEGYYTKFNGTGSKAAEGRSIVTYKWCFWHVFRESFFEFATSVFRPNGDGTYKAWTHPVRVGNYMEWDDITQDADSTYVRATAGGMYESSTLTDHTHEIWPIGGVRVTIVARNTLKTDDKVRLMLVIGGIKYEGKAYNLSTTYSPYTSYWEINPRYNIPWNWTAIDTLEAGVKSEAVGAWSGEIRVTQLYVEVIPASTLTGLDVVNYNYTRRGTWPITLTVIDDAGVVNSTTKAVIIYAHDIFFTGIKMNVTKGTYPPTYACDIGEIIKVNVTAINEGNFTETFDVTCFWRAFYLNKWYSGLIGVGTMHDITLTAGAITTLTFYWDTTGRNITHPDTFIIHANASAVPYEFDKERAPDKIADNEFKSEAIRIRFHDVRVKDITPPYVKPDKIVQIKVIVDNDGDFNETNISVTLYNGTTVIGTQIIPYMENKSYGDYPRPRTWEWVLTFNWNTAGVKPGLYTLKAVASQVPGEIDTSDNTCLRTVYVVILGDINLDGKVNPDDFYLFSAGYGTSIGEWGYVPKCDLDEDGHIGPDDFYIFSGNYGKHI